MVLVYLGLLHADEMSDRGEAISDPEAWERAVTRHSRVLFPPEVWGTRWLSHGQAFIPLIRSLTVSLADATQQ